jgi:hypothetical protein
MECYWIVVYYKDIFHIKDEVGFAVLPVTGAETGRWHFWGDFSK